MEASTTYACPACDAGRMKVFYELRDFPVHTVINIATKTEAINYRRGDVCLAFCSDCGFISNVAFDQKLIDYCPDCEETQGFSPTFRAFASRSAHQLVDRYNLKGKTILEIGCGKGEFLSMLCEHGQNRGVGFDPAYLEGRIERPSENNVEFVRDYYSEKYSHYKADFICCLMTLEHIQTAGSFVGMVRRAIAGSRLTVVFFQVPDVTRILRDCSFEDIYYEHCSYFSQGSLARLFKKSGFDILDIRTEYDGQYLMIDARPAAGAPVTLSPVEDDLAQLKGYVSTFSDRVKEKLSVWQKSMDLIADKRLRGVIWGSGSKGVAFLMNPGFGSHIEYVVDINPHRQGMFMPGTGHEIIAPAALKKIQPDLVIVMNRIYEQEVKEELNRMGLSPQVLAL